MARNPTIRPADVHLDFGLKASVSGAGGFSPSGSENRDQPESFRFNFGNQVAVSLLADVTVALDSPRDRNLCDLQLMQFVTPRKYESVYAGIRGGNTRVQYDGSIENRQFLDGHAVSTSDFTQKNAPFMSFTKAADFRPTSGGHFVNQCIDTPASNEPSWLVVLSPDPLFHGEKHFLFKTDRLDEFLTIAVFIHPDGTRQPIAMAGWTCQHSYRFFWTQTRDGREKAEVVFGSSTIVQKSAPTSDPAALLPHVAKVRSPPKWILPEVNPQLVAAFAGAGASGKSRTSSPLDHPDAGFGIFNVER